MNHDEPTIKDVLDAISEFSSDMDGQFEGLKKELKGDINDIKGDINGIKGEINGIKGDIDGIKGEIQEIKRDISSINTRLDSIEIDIQSIKADLRKLAQKDHEDSDALSRAYAQLEKRIVELEREVKQMRQAGQPRFA